MRFVCAAILLSVLTLKYSANYSVFVFDYKQVLAGKIIFLSMTK